MRVEFLPSPSPRDQQDLEYVLWTHFEMRHGASLFVSLYNSLWLLPWRHIKFCFLFFLIKGNTWPASDESFKVSACPLSSCCLLPVSCRAIGQIYSTLQETDRVTTDRLQIQMGSSIPYTGKLNSVSFSITESWQHLYRAIGQIRVNPAYLQSFTPY